MPPDNPPSNLGYIGCALIVLVFGVLIVRDLPGGKERMQNLKDTMNAVGSGAVLMLSLALPLAVLYIAWHFIAKYW